MAEISVKKKVKNEKTNVVRMFGVAVDICSIAADCKRGR